MLDTPDIEKLSCECGHWFPSSKNSACVSLFGVDAEDFVACCDSEFLREVIRVAGEDFCDEVFDRAEKETLPKKGK